MDSADISAVSLFAGLSPEQLDRVAAGAGPLHFAPGEVIVGEGEFAFDLYAIVRGHAEVRHGSDRVAEIGAGAVLGELALVPGPGARPTRRRGASVVATEAVDAVVIKGSELRAM